MCLSNDWLTLLVQSISTWGWGSVTDVAMMVAAGTIRTRTCSTVELSTWNMFVIAARSVGRGWSERSFYLIVLHPYILCHCKMQQKKRGCFSLFSIWCDLIIKRDGSWWFHFETLRDGITAYCLLVLYLPAVILVEFIHIKPFNSPHHILFPNLCYLVFYFVSFSVSLINWMDGQSCKEQTRLFKHVIC